MLIEQYSDGPQTVQILTARIVEVPDAVERYTKQMKPFLPEGAAVVATGSVFAGGVSVQLGNISPTQRRFAFTYLTR